MLTAQFSTPGIDITSIFSSISTMLPCCSVVGEAITREINGSKQWRYGPQRPTTGLRAVVDYWVERNAPIPVLVPWGGSKQGPFDVDLAELMAIRQMQCLHERVAKHYPPSVEFHIRLEDATDFLLFDNHSPTQSYCSTLVSLIEMFGAPYINVRRETAMMSFTEFATKACQNADAIFQAIMHDDQRWRLAHIGWSGNLPLEQIDYYRNAYRNFYPELTDTEQLNKIAMYFGASLARVKMNGTGADPLWDSQFIVLSFTPPIPGIPSSMDAKRVYYRTIPERFSNCHKAPWIGKGYFRVCGSKATPAVAGWSGDGLNYHSNTVELTVADKHITIQADMVMS